MTLKQTLDLITERQISDDTRLRRVVAIFQRQLGKVFGNATVNRRNRKYQLKVAVYEKPTSTGRAYKMPDRQIQEWVRQAAERAHPRLYKRMTVNILPWQHGGVSNKLFAPLEITVDAVQTP